MAATPPVQLDLLDPSSNDRATTARYPNRIRDKRRVEMELGLPEFGCPDIKLYTPAGTLLAEGYVRIVYGDHRHGYVELAKEQLRAPLQRKFGRPPPADAYYDWLETQDACRVKVYAQLRDVHDLPNPPAGGFRGNRAEGYADYKPGMFYVDVWELARGGCRAERCSSG